MHQRIAKRRHSGRARPAAPTHRRGRIRVDLAAIRVDLAAIRGDLAAVRSPVHYSGATATSPAPTGRHPTASAPVRHRRGPSRKTGRRKTWGHRPGLPPAGSWTALGHDRPQQRGRAAPLAPRGLSLSLSLSPPRRLRDPRSLSQSPRQRGTPRTAAYSGPRPCRDRVRVTIKIDVFAVMGPAAGGPTAQGAGEAQEGRQLVQRGGSTFPPRAPLTRPAMRRSVTARRRRKQR
jgi:hypothetical protein